MRAFRALLAKELAIYFGSPLVYVVAAAFLAYTGYYFHSDLIYFLTFGFGLNIMENFWQLVFMDVRLVLIFSVPPRQWNVLSGPATKVANPVPWCLRQREQWQ